MTYKLKSLITVLALLRSWDIIEIIKKCQTVNIMALTSVYVNIILCE